MVADAVRVQISRAAWRLFFMGCFMGAFSDLVGSKNKSVSGGSASDLGGAGDTSIYKEKTKTERKSGGGKNKAVKHSIKKGGAASDRSGVADDVKRYLKGSAAGEVVTGGGLSADLLPVSVSDVSRLLPVWVGMWCDSNGVQDIRKISPLVFGSMCGDIGRYIKQSGILKDTTRKAAGACVGSTCNRYDPASVMALYDLFCGFCGACDKVPFQTVFARFCGVSLSYIREYTRELTSSGLDIAKKTHDIEMDCIRQKTSADSIGRLAILNNEYYSGGGSASGGADVVAASLPASGSFGLIECGKID